MQYYLFSWKHSQKGDMLSFWRPEGSGYTWNLEEAGIYNENMVCGQICVANTKIKLQKFQKMKKYVDASFLIPVDKIEDILGKKKTVIFR